MTIKLPSGSCVRIFDELDSTSLEAKRQFVDGVAGQTWFLARHQTGGYGRQGRKWQQQPGNFAASLLLPVTDGISADTLALASFASALAVADAAEAEGVPSDQLSLKWPNDVLLNGAKLSGLLLELQESENRRALVIGIGVNLSYAPVVPDYATACLSDVLSAPTLPNPEQFLARLDAHLDQHLQTLFTDGFQVLRKAWLERAANIGKSVTARLPRETITGIFEGIDETGALLLRDDFRQYRITSGDVFFASA